MEIWLNSLKCLSLVAKTGPTHCTQRALGRYEKNGPMKVTEHPKQAQPTTHVMHMATVETWADKTLCPTRPNRGRLWLAVDLDSMIVRDDRQEKSGARPHT
jgi:hypothetical protein